mgnify:CR=1 FL=1
MANYKEQENSKLKKEIRTAELINKVKQEVERVNKKQEENKKWI